MFGKHFPKVELHALAQTSSPGVVRVWAGIFGDAPTEGLDWYVDGKGLDPDQVKAVRDLAFVRPSKLGTQTGVFDIRLPDRVGEGEHFHEAESNAAMDADPALCTVGLEVRWADGSSWVSSIQTRPLPDQMPRGFRRSLRVLLVSCFYQPKDKNGEAGKMAAALTRKRRPDLVLTVGDQVYLDVNPLRPGLVFRRYAKTFLNKYRDNWQTEDLRHGYADVLRAGPVAAIPDDHEYWNNYPIRGLLGPPTDKAKESWNMAAHDMFTAFQLRGAENEDSYTYVLDVAPMSFFMMDNRSFRNVHMTRSSMEVVSLLSSHLERYRAWVQRMIDSPDAVPVLVTGPSLLQEPARHPMIDINFPDVTEYPEIMAGLIAMSEAGCSPLALTGDVHYPRVTKAETRAGTSSNPWGVIYEVISSPGSIVLGQKDKKSSPQRPNFQISAGHGRKLACTRIFPADPDMIVGNHLVELEFTRQSTGIELMVRYWPTRKRGPDLGGCHQVGPISLKRQPSARRATSAEGSTSTWTPPPPTRIRDPAPSLTIVEDTQDTK